MSVDLIVEGAIATVILNRPERMNALTVEMRELMRDHFSHIRFDDSIRAVIVTGAGTNFCSGADVGRMGGHSDIRASRQRLQYGSHSFIRLMHATEKPVIAAVQGVAVGVGWSIALACDIIVAADTARFSQVFRRVGLAPDGGAAWFLARRIGVPRAKELAFSGQMVGAEEALRLGLVEHVVPADQLSVRAAELAADFASGPTFALGLAKKMFDKAIAPSLEDFLDLEAMVQPALNQTTDHAEGVAAFREKRKPSFTG
ncbi:MAG: enoyl-CoA hydratase/isomerase family protein, partial [Acetobacteraceae bacterium]